MASQRTAQVVATAFVDQYYAVFNKFPSKLSGFYNDNRTVSHANHGDLMLEATPKQAINCSILSIGHEQQAEVNTIDAQHSLHNGLVVFVTGSLSSSDGVKRSFSQAFFLAPHENGYFVRSDIFMYQDSDHTPSSVVVSRKQEELHIQDQEEENLQELDHQHVQEHVEKQEQKVLQKESREASTSVSSYNANDSSENVEAPVAQVVELNGPAEPIEAQTSTPSTVQRDAPIKSYASIVKLLTENPSAFVVPPLSKLPASAKLPAPSKKQQPPSKLPPSAKLPAPSKKQQQVEDNSIFVRNVPYDTTPKQLEEEFKRFGPVKPRGIYVRNNHQLGTCFAFVDFEAHSSVDTAIKASPLRMDGRPIYIEKKLPRGLAIMSPRTKENESLIRGDSRRGVSSDGKVVPAATVTEAKLSPPSTIQGEVEKKTSASIVKVLSENPAPLAVPARTQATPASNFPPSAKLPAPSMKQQEVEDNSIFVRNLPFHATPEQLEGQFKRIGPVKRRGIYIRRNHNVGTCFAFVEFEERRSVEDAIRASPLRMDGRPIYIEKKLPRNVQTNNEKESFERVGSSKGSMAECIVDKKVEYSSRVNSKAEHSGSNGANKGGTGMGGSVNNRGSVRVNSSSSINGSAKSTGSSNAPQKPSS